jgi:hypothetical protein
MALDAVQSLVEARLADACVQVGAPHRGTAAPLYPRPCCCTCLPFATSPSTSYPPPSPVQLRDARLLSPRTANFQQRFEVGVNDATPLPLPLPLPLL